METDLQHEPAGGKCRSTKVCVVRRRNRRDDRQPKTMAIGVVVARSALKGLKERVDNHLSSAFNGNIYICWARFALDEYGFLVLHAARRGDESGHGDCVRVGWIEVRSPRRGSLEGNERKKQGPEVVKREPGIAGGLVTS